MQSTISPSDSATLPSPKKDKFPMVIRRGSLSVTIYANKTIKGEIEYPEFVLVYRLGGSRVKRKFADFARARAEADLAMNQMAKGEIEALKLTGNDRSIYLQAVEKLRPLGMPLNEAVSDYVTARMKLPGAVKMIEIADFYLRHNPVGMPEKTVRGVVDELISSKETPTKNKRPASVKYLADLRGRLGRFAEYFACPIKSITPEQILSFLNELNVEGRTWFNYARLIQTLFRFAQEKGYFPRDIEPLKGIDVEYDDDGEIEIFSPSELSKLFDHAREEIIPFLAIGAFAGLRHAEITRLDWADIKLSEGFIEVKKGKAKTRSRRLVPIQPNLKLWLAPRAAQSGPVTQFANMSKQVLKLGADAGVKWKHNALRHSFISYRMQMVKNENLVAGEAGNSPQMIYGHYRELVSDVDAKAWFAIEPKATENVTSVSFNSDQPGATSVSAG